jgi:TolB-like protein
VHLAARHGVTVSREELLDAVWKTRFVVEEALTRCISQLRQSLDDDPRNPQFLQTIPKLGYRLLIAPEPIPPVQAALPVTAMLAARPMGLLRTPIGRALFMTIGVGVLAGLWWATSHMLDASTPAESRVQGEPTLWPAPQESVAILPFVSMGADAADAAFADGMTEELIQLLARVPRLRVPSRTSSFHFRDRKVPIATIGRQLGVAHVLEGSIRREGERLRITVQLIDVRNDAHIWSEVYDRTLADIFDVQQQIATSIAQKLADSLRLELAIGRTSATKDMVAYQLYLEARVGQHEPTKASMQASIELYKSALERDPQFAAAWEALALTYWTLPGYADVDPSEVPRLDALATAAAERALALDDSLGGAHMVFADYDHSQRRSAAAEARHRRALAAVPGNVALHVGYAAMLGETGRLAESLRHRQIAWTLEPLSGNVAFHLARGYSLGGRYDDALRLARLSRQLGFDMPSLDHLEAYLQVHARNFEAARALWVKHGDSEEARVMVQVLQAVENPQLRPAALTAISALPPWNALPFRGRFFAACLLGDREAAFQAAAAGVEGGLDATDNWWIPEATLLRADSRFPELARRMNFVPAWHAYGWPDACQAEGDIFKCT